MTVWVFASIATFGSAHPVIAQGVDPLKVLEKERRDRLEMDQRLAREAVARRLKENADQATQVNAQRIVPKEQAALVAGPSSEVPADPEKNSAGAPLSAALPSSMASRASNSAESPSAPEPSPGAPLPTASPTSVGSVVPEGNDPAKPLPNIETTAGPPPTPPTRVLITIDKAAQRMLVTVDGKLRHSWPVSTGREQFETPTGTFRPLRLAKEHYSREWDDAPMPHSIFFTSRGHAIHGSNDTRRLGRRASHGCVRLAPSKAAALFALVQAEGPSATKVTIMGGDAAKTARVTGQSRRREASTSRIGPVRRVSPDSWLTGPGDDWFE